MNGGVPIKVVLWILGVLVLLVAVSVPIMNIGMGEVKGLEIGAVDLSKLADGTYRGSFKRGRWAYKVEVTIKDHRIEKIVLLDDKWKVMEKVGSELVGRIIQRQSPQVDVVSQATVTSKALLKAVENALNSEPVN